MNRKFDIRQTLINIEHGIKYALWPSKCTYCSCAVSCSDDVFCQTCWSSLSELASGSYCTSCGLDASPYSLIDGRCERCQSQTLHFDGIARLGRYDGLLRDMVIRLKESDAIDTLEPLGHLLKSAIIGRFGLDRIDCLVPVPIYWSRRLLRGFNQSALIAKSLNMNIDIVNCLARTVPTRYQSKLTQNRRIANMADVFALKSNADIKGRTVCLVDDIKTTGATLSECAMILKQAGAHRVYAAVLAVAGQSKADKQLS